MDIGTEAEALVRRHGQEGALEHAKIRIQAGKQVVQFWEAVVLAIEPRAVGHTGPPVPWRDVRPHPIGPNGEAPSDTEP